MTDVTAPTPAPGARIRKYRNDRKWNLDYLADLIAKEGVGRPSIAKLSRIEKGIQPVAIDILPVLSKITGIPERELRPDIAALATRMFEQEAAA